MQTFHATTDGSRMMIPFPFINTSVLAVPKSMPMSFPNITFFPPAKILNSCADLRYSRVLPRCPARSSIYFTSNLSENWLQKQSKAIHFSRQKADKLHYPIYYNPKKAQSQQEFLNFLKAAKNYRFWTNALCTTAFLCLKSLSFCPSQRLEPAVERSNRKTHYIEVVPADALHQQTAVALDAVGSRLVIRLVS